MIFDKTICSRSVLIGLLSLSAQAIFGITQPANTTTVLDSPDSFLSTLPALLKHGHAVVQLGGSQNRQGKKQHINITSAIGDEFTVTHHQDSNGLVGLGYFIDGQEENCLAMTYGINAFYLAKTTVRGNVIQENLFTNLSYDYNMTHYPVYAVAKATFKTKLPQVAFTVDAGIGPNFMKAWGFHEHSLDGGVTNPDNSFSGHTATTFSATAGFGVKFNHLFGAVPLECGYRFFYLGQGRFDKNTHQLLSTLNTGSGYANAVMCSITME